ncbi:hypothetical protein [Streptomyces werraensis]|uniref:hypothetical protein n=1 Tax=Streptomyces werraensis TaxID=68284 RepID=UPI0038035362
MEEHVNPCEHFLEGERPAAPCYPHPCVDGIDFRILVLMHAGLSDSAIGRKLGLGLRTIQRRVRGMMERTESPSRFVFGITIGHIGALRDEEMWPLLAGQSSGRRMLSVPSKEASASEIRRNVD